MKRIKLTEKIMTYDDCIKAGFISTHQSERLQKDGGVRVVEIKAFGEFTLHKLETIKKLG